MLVQLSQIIALEGVTDFPSPLIVKTMLVFAQIFFLDSPAFAQIRSIRSTDVLSTNLHPPPPCRMSVDCITNASFLRYIEWASHEPEPGVYDFSGMLNFTDFVMKAQEEDLMVILRPGPFIDAERDMVSQAVHLRGF